MSQGCPSVRQRSHYQSGVFVCVSTISRGCGRSAFSCTGFLNSFLSLPLNPPGPVFTSGRSKAYSVTPACLSSQKDRYHCNCRGLQKLFLLQGHQLPLLSLLESLHEKVYENWRTQTRQVRLMLAIRHSLHTFILQPFFLKDKKKHFHYFTCS